MKQNMEQRQIDRIPEELKNTRRNEIGSGFISGFFLGAGIGGLIVYNVGGFDYGWIMLASTVSIVVSVVFAIISGVYHKKYRDLKKRL
jgi:Mg/Co/Ni transporter MgtE